MIECREHGCIAEVTHKRVSLCSLHYKEHRTKQWLLNEAKRCEKDKNRHQEKLNYFSDMYYSKYRQIRLVDKMCACGIKALRGSRYSLCRDCSNNRRKLIPQLRLKHRLRSRLNKMIKGNYKSGSAVRDLGCSIDKLRIHLQLKFHRNPRGNHEYMTWDNWSTTGWHIDHKRPLSFFNLEDPEQFKEACHYTNLRPMWAIDNLRKGSKHA